MASRCRRGLVLALLAAWAGPTASSASSSSSGIVELGEVPGPSIPDAPDERLVLTRDVFEQKLRNRSFTSWADLQKTVGPDAALQPDVGGEVPLMSGLTIAFVIILNVVVFSVVGLIMMYLINTHPRAAGWSIFAFLCLYGLVVNLYCQWAYRDPEQRIITNFLFGMVPLAVSAACYVLALLLVDAVRSLGGEGWEVDLGTRVRPWEESFLGRLIFFLAVLPGLSVSIYLGNTVSTGFKAAAAHLDVLSLCLFVDVGRFVGHFSYLVARDWSIGASGQALPGGPGLCYVFLGLCLVWYVVLARIEAGHRSVVLEDATKVHTLVSLTSFMFFPLSISMIARSHIQLRDSYKGQSSGVPPRSEAFDSDLEPAQNSAGSFFCVTCFEPSLVLSTLMVGIFMLLVGVVFDAIEPNLMGIGVLLGSVFYTAIRISNCQLLVFILALLPLAALAFGLAILASQHGVVLRESLLGALAPTGQQSP